MLHRPSPHQILQAKHHLPPTAELEKSLVCSAAELSQGSDSRWSRFQHCSELLVYLEAIDDQLGLADVATVPGRKGSLGYQLPPPLHLDQSIIPYWHSLRWRVCSNGYLEKTPESTYSGDCRLRD